jgi:release factor glutamine methyltransferase
MLSNFWCTKVSIKILIKFALMTLKEIQQKYHLALSKIYNTGEVNGITNIALEEIAAVERNEIISNANKTLEPNLIEKLHTALDRLCLYEPVQYVVGSTWFYNLKFIVTNAVLIPRPETEELVFEAINFLKNNPNKKVIDIGTGSGCIPISIKKNVTDSIVSALDVSKAALGIAKENANTNNTSVHFYEIDFLEEKNYDQLGKYDLIISNPPYIPNTEILEENVTNFEPHIALFVPENDVLIFYKKILKFTENHLEKDGIIMLEVHENLAKECAALFTKNSYEVKIKLDMQGKERMLIIYRCQ